MNSLEEILKEQETQFEKLLQEAEWETCKNKDIKQGDILLTSSGGVFKILIPAPPSFTILGEEKWKDSEFRGRRLKRK